MSIEQWRQVTDELDHLLMVAASRVKATAEESELRIMRQAEANSINWKLAAYELADPVLEDLYKDYSLARSNEKSHRSQSQDDTAKWGTVAGVFGVISLLLLLISSAVSVSGWIVLVAALLLAGAAVSVLLAVTAHRDMPDTVTSMNLRARICEIEDACKDCDSVDGYQAVKAVLRPTRQSAPSTEVATHVR